MKKSILTLLILMTISISTIFAQYANALRIKINGYGYTDETIIRLVDGATPDFDGAFDAWKLISPDPMVPSIYTTIPSSDKLSINSLPLYETDTTVDVHAKVAASGLYTITIEEVFAFDDDYIISVTDLDAEETYSFTGGTMTFTAVLLPNTTAPSFKFNISKTFTTAIETNTNINEAFTVATKGNGNYGLLFNETSLKTMTVYDITGKVVTEDKINTNNYNLNINNNPSGLYIIAINNGKETVTKKIFR